MTLVYLGLGTAFGFVLSRSGATVFREPIRVETKPQHLGNVLGGLLFGLGWPMSGLCPGPLLVKLQPRMPLPPLEVGPGEG